MWNYSNTSAETTLTATVTAGATSIAVASTAGLPVSFPYTLVLDFGSANQEVVTVTALAGLNLTVSRGEDGTTGQSHNLGARVVHAVVARDLREPQQHIEASGTVHGVGGASNVVGTATAQVLTNKTISGAANTLTNLPASALVGQADDLVVVASGVNAVPLTVRAVAGQVGDRQRWENHLGVATTRINAAGDLFVDQLRTDGSMSVDGDVAITGAATTTGGVTAGGVIEANRTGGAVATDPAFRSKLAADAEYRWSSRVDGRLLWGPGNAAPDVNLYRSTADLLKTDDSLEVVGTVTAASVSAPNIPLGFIGEHVATATTSANTTELIHSTITATLVTGRRYKLSYSGMLQGTQADALAAIRMRYLAGAVLTISGTQFKIVAPHITVAARNIPFSMLGTFTAPSTGQFTVGISILRNNGAGDVSLNVSAGLQDPHLLLEGI